MGHGVSGDHGAHALKQNTATEACRFALERVAALRLKAAGSYVRGLDQRAKNVRKQTAKVCNKYAVWSKTCRRGVSYFFYEYALKNTKGKGCRDINYINRDQIQFEGDKPI